MITRNALYLENRDEFHASIRARSSIGCMIAVAKVEKTSIATSSTQHAYVASYTIHVVRWEIQRSSQIRRSMNMILLGMNERWLFKYSVPTNGM